MAVARKVSGDNPKPDTLVCHTGPPNPASIHS